MTDGVTDAPDFTASWSATPARERGFLFSRRRPVGW